ncbi:MAG TPA: BREX system ATP-binding domain-containing protein, partial [Dehalococcoidia bacterium]|nr:BREX system ATP-binding domain-containing protein [Dehalococcoidia bacterium]
MMTATRISSWRAIEALRAGVPNRDAVQALGMGSVQPDIEARFRQMLSKVQEGSSSEVTGEVTADGMLVAGDFGAGKSHLLEYLQHVALENNFVCSKVVVSKETPLYDTGKVYSSAIQSAKVPDRAGTLLNILA